MIYNDVSPIAFTLGPVSITWYGMMVALAVLTLVIWALWSVKKGAKVSYDTVVSAAIVGIPSGIIFSRLLHVIDFWDYFMENPGQIIGGAGLSIYGAVLGAALGIWLYSRFRRISFGYFADMLAPGIILAQAIGRVGCTLNGCCYGIETDLFCAMVYTNPESNGPIGIPVHPTQIYEIIYNLIVFGVLLVLRKRFRPDGSLFLMYLTLYSVWRLGIDFIREGTDFLFGLHEAQVIAIIVLIITITLMGLRTRWVKKEESPSPPQ
ncbi:MAG: prolipoprotein diacylglyceryl transferase [Dehalococcoidales bacterium]|nr:prolipoprotein diacylglyceryl transferase [Dehalococcoidales bacterium]